MQHGLVCSHSLDGDLALIQRKEFGYCWRIGADYEEAQTGQNGDPMA